MENRFKNSCFTISFFTAKVSPSCYDEVMSAQSSLLQNFLQYASADSQQLIASAGLIPPATTSSEPTDEEKLDLFNNVLDEVERESERSNDSATVNQSISDEARLFASVPPQAIPQATEHLWQQAQPVAPRGQTGKERAVKPWSLDAAVEEFGGMLTPVEQEKQPEISPELETYLQRIEDAQASPAAELAKLIPQVASSASAAPTEVVRVLPVSKAIAQEGRKKNPKFSIRWLVEWSDKVIKMFQGKTVYRPAESASSEA